MYLSRRVYLFFSAGWPPGNGAKVGVPLSDLFHERGLAVILCSKRTAKVGKEVLQMLSVN